MTAPQGYTRQQIIVHWLSVVVIAAQFLFSDGISEAYRDGLRAGALTFTGPAIAHIAAGSLVLLLVVWRILLKRERGTLPPPAGEPGWAATLAKFAHPAIYIVLLALPITGVMAWGGELRSAGEVHQVLTNVFIALVVAHVGAVAVHQFVWKTGLLARMTRPEG